MNSSSNITENSTTDDLSNAECATSTKNLEKIESSSTEKVGEPVDVKIIYNKNKYDISTTLTTTVAELKRELQGLLGIFCFINFFLIYY